MLLQELKDNKYKPGNYHEFTTKEPKERLIKALPFRDRIVHQWYIEEFIKPYIIPRFITDSYSFGNYTSQYFANMYLNELDYFVKEDLKVKYYIRYMDDFVMLLDNKNECIRVMREINDFLNDRLHLKLNKKSKYFHNKYGINFLGYRIFNDYRLLRKNSIKKIKKNVRIWKKRYKDDLLKNKEVELSLNSWYAHIKHCDSYGLKNKINDMVTKNI